MKNSQYTMEYNSPVGPLTIASDGESITGIWMKGQKYYAATLSGHVSEAPLPVFDRAVAWLDSYFKGEAPEVTLPLAPQGSEFRRSVWEILLKIPYGEVITYGGIAKEMAAKMGKGTMSAQAVGGAVGHNPISIIIPCHRVVGSDGSLTGYAGGIEKKIKLLRLEKADMSALFPPAVAQQLRYGMRPGMQYRSINTGQPQRYEFGGIAFESSVKKTKSKKPLFLSANGMEGDNQSDKVNHGGLYKAVFFYEISHYREWEKELGRRFPCGSLGETVSTEGFDEKSVCIGDIYRIGTALIQVTQPRQPCYKLGCVAGIKDFPVWVEQSGRTGVYAKVLEEGVLDPAGEIELVEKHQMGLSVYHINRLLASDRENREEMERALQNEALSPRVVSIFTNRLKGEMEQTDRRLFGAGL